MHLLHAKLSLKHKMMQLIKHKSKYIKRNKNILRKNFLADFIYIIFMVYFFFVLFYGILINEIFSLISSISIFVYGSATFLGCFNTKDFTLETSNGRFLSMNMKFIMDIKPFLLTCFICINMI